MLESYSFKNVLKRGFSIVWDKNEIINSKQDLEKLSSATIEFSDGKIDVFTSKQSKDSKKHNKKIPENNNQGSLF